MTKPPSGKELRFDWLTALIVLPVVVLATFGLFSLRQDRLLAEQEARQTGEAVAGGLAQIVAEETGKRLEDFREASLHLDNQRRAALGIKTFQVAASRDHARNAFDEWQRANPDIDLTIMPVCNCRLSSIDAAQSPREYPLVPDPPLWLRQLSPQQKELWTDVQRSAWSADASDIRSKLARFYASNLPAGARANAELLFLELEACSLPPGKAAQQFAESSLSSSGEETETGLPVGQLVCYHALRSLPDHAGISASLLQEIVWIIENHPSILTPLLLEELDRLVDANDKESLRKVDTMRAWWQAQERARQVLRDWQAQGSLSTSSNGLFWIASSVGDFLIAFDDGGTASPEPGTDADETSFRNVALFPQPVVWQALNAARAKAEAGMPAYAQASVEIGGRWLCMDTGLAHPSAVARSWSLLAEATGHFRNLQIPAEASVFTIRVDLVHPDILYARQRQRTLLFGGLIAASALAAIVGLVAAQGAFRRQVELNEAKSNFVSSVSHELRAPIASVRLMAESLEQGQIQDPVRQQEYFRFIGQECRRLSGLIENVLDFSRIEQGRKQYEFEPTDLVALTRETVRLMETYAAEKQVRLALKLDETETGTQNLEPVLDGRALQQALVNLIDNAIKHSPQGETVTVGLEHSPAAVSLWVEDHGPGIPAEEHERIFERFYRRGSELRRETQGVGIGLSIVKHIVEAHGGNTRVRSAVGQGSRFTIELPMKTGETN